MAKEARDRYQEPIEVADALAEWADQPITPPPPREMPVHCPQVQALAGPNAGGSGTNTPLARVLFGSNRGSLAMRTGSGGSSVVRGRKPPSTTASTTTSGGSDANLSGEGAVQTGGPVSTARSSVSPTAPIQNRPESQVPLQPGSGLHNPAGSSPGTSTVYVVHHPRRTGLYIVIGVLFALLFVVGAVAAYYIGRSERTGQVPAPPSVQRAATRPAKRNTRARTRRR